MYELIVELAKIFNFFFTVFKTFFNYISYKSKIKKKKNLIDIFENYKKCRNKTICKVKTLKFRIISTIPIVYTGKINYHLQFFFYFNDKISDVQ